MARVGTALKSRPLSQSTRGTFNVVNSFDILKKTVVYQGED